MSARMNKEQVKMQFNDVMLQCQAHSISFTNEVVRLSLSICNLKSAAFNPLNDSKNIKIIIVLAV